MSSYEILKIIHIVSACLLLGSGIGGLSAIIGLNQCACEALLRRFLPITLFVSTLLLIIFALVQSLTGFAIISQQHYAWRSGWVTGIWMSFSASTLCYLTALYFQLRCCHILQQSGLGPDYQRYYQKSLWMSLPLSLFLFILYFLMSNILQHFLL